VRVLLICLISLAGIAGASAQDNADELVITGWHLCSDTVKHACIADLKNVPVFDRDGDSLGARDLSSVHVPLSSEYNPAVSIVKIAGHGCKGQGANDDSCWVEKRILQVRYCANGALRVTGTADAASQSATSMGSGAGCRQS
jgi:hypothetical protein